MNTFKFGKKLVFANLKRNMLYATTVSFATAVMFGLFNLVFQPQYQENYSIQGVSMGFTSVVLFLAAMSVLYCNTFFIAEKLKEIAIMTVSGVTVTQLEMTLFFEHSIIFVLSLPLGIVLSLISSVSINHVANLVLDLDFSIFAIRSEAVISIVIILLVNVVYLALIDTSYLFKDKEVIDLLALNGKMAKPDTRVYKIPGFIYVILYVFPLILFTFFRSDDFVVQTIIFVYVGIYGMSGVIRYVLPKVIVKIKRKRFMTDGVHLMALGNYHYSMRSSELLILLIGICTNGLGCAVCYYQDNRLIGLVAIFSYIIVSILLAVCLIYKIIVEVVRRAKNFKQIQLTGFGRKAVVRMIRLELVYYFISLLIITLPYLFFTFYAHVVAGNVSANFAIGLLLFNIAVIVVGGIITYIAYKTYILRKLKGGFGDEK